MMPRLFVLAVCLCLAVGLAAGSAAQPADLDPRIQKLLADISEERLKILLTKLQSFETRNTLSSQDNPSRGIGGARQWILDEMKRSSPRLQVSFDGYQIAAQGRIARDVDLRNVMAVLPGKSPRRIYVSGHYDSLARAATPPSTPSGGQGRPQGAPPAAPPRAPAVDAAPAPVDNFAPGANDDGSGTVLTMELARVFAESGLEFDATLVFIALAGEEQGLIGAHAHAQKAEADKLVIDAVLNNDMVGNVRGGSGVDDGESVRVFAEGPEDSPSRQLARFIRRQAARYEPAHQIRLIARHDRFGRGGDHTAFNQHGYTAVRITEANENYARQHTVEDTIDAVSFAYVLKNARINAAAVAVLALAPPAPKVTSERGSPMLGRQPSGYDAQLRWAASPGAAGYRVFWREAWAPDWQHEMTVGNVTEVVLPDVSIDDYVFGVAAIGPGGHESLVSAYVNPPRADATIKVKE